MITDEQRNRIHDITCSTDDREELAERIVALEEEIDKQKFKFEVLKAHGIEIVDAVLGGHEIYDTRQREVDRLEYENAKLRKLVLDMRKAFFTLDIDHCQACPRDNVNGPCTKYRVGGSDECDFDICMRDLGIEV